MKKRLFSVTLCSLLLFSCNKVNKFYLSEKYYTSENKGLQEITENSYLKQLQDNKESFGLYVFGRGCSSCAAFSPIIEEFLNTYEIMFYSIEFNLIKNSNLDVQKVAKYTPTVVLYEEGKIATYLDPIKDEHIEYFSSLDGFTKWVAKYVELTSES